MDIKRKDKAKEKSTNLGGQGNRGDSEKRQRRCVERKIGKNRDEKSLSTLKTLKLGNDF